MRDNIGVILIGLLLIIGLFNIFSDAKDLNADLQKRSIHIVDSSSVNLIWTGQPASQIPYYGPNGKLIWYGYQLVKNTSYYLGTHGTVSHTANSLNCQNCHLEGGTKPFGNNFGKVSSTYPLYRSRNDAVQNIQDRINDCMVRSMNGQTLAASSKEMKAIEAYIRWLGKDVPKGKAYGGTKIKALPLLDRPASPTKGKLVFQAKCQICHGVDGLGQKNFENTGYTYPPLWGPESYNDGAGMFRLKSIAAFVYTNMPFGTDYKHPELTKEQAWDVGAFVNSQPRPHLDQSQDWLQLAKKPVDYPKGPYISKDTFSEAQHKYGPFQPIQAVYSKTSNGK